jgi:hypothetical protein
MLSSVLRTDRAIEVNIAIMRAFVKLRDVLATHKEFGRKLEDIERKLRPARRAFSDCLRGDSTTDGPSGGTGEERTHRLRSRRDRLASQSDNNQGKQSPGLAPRFSFSNHLFRAQLAGRLLTGASDHDES